MQEGCFKASDRTDNRLGEQMREPDMRNKQTCFIAGPFCRIGKGRTKKTQNHAATVEDTNDNMSPPSRCDKEGDYAFLPLRRHGVGGELQGLSPAVSAGHECLAARGGQLNAGKMQSLHRDMRHLAHQRIAHLRVRLTQSA